MSQATPFADRLAGAVRRCANPLVVGLDPRVANLPAGMLGADESSSPHKVAAAFREFCNQVIDVVAPLVCAVKPQSAFFEEVGPPGMAALAEVITYARQHGLLVILDGKRNDIGSTAEAYAKAYLGIPPNSVWGADALTVSPYLGEDSLTPFVQIAQKNDAGIFVLVKTSNPGSGLFQDLIADGQPVYEHVADLVQRLAKQTVGESGYGVVGAVVGATYPQQLAKLRAAMTHSWLLVPGFGVQGGSARDVAGAFDANGLGAVISSSRAIIFAHQRPEFRDKYGDRRWQQAVEAATREAIEQLRAETPAGKLRP